MQQLPEALAPLAAFKQFILYKLVPSKSKPGKKDKLPVDHRTLQVFLKNSGWQSDPEAWTTFENSARLVKYCGAEFGVGFFFTEADPFYFLDIDDCLEPGGAAWSPLALELIGRLPGAAVEISQSGTGLHIFGRYTGAAEPHACKNVPLGLELYTDKRFVALTGAGATGSAALDCTANLAAVVATYFSGGGHGVEGMRELTDEPVAEFTGTYDDDELIRRACATKSAKSAFGGGSNFETLWKGDEDALATSYPDDGGRTYDASSADAALAQHLAFWTGKHELRMLQLMERSGLVRDKWEDRAGYYLERTILRAVGLQESVYSVVAVDTTISDELGASKLKGSKKQQEFAAGIRAQKLVDCAGEADLIEALLANHGPTASAKFWIENKDSTPEEIAAAAAPIDAAVDPLGDLTGPELCAGYQYLSATNQIELFKGCVYIQDAHKVFTPRGFLLKSEQFNATYGGYSFQLEADGSGKVTRKAWEAFTESQAVRYPKAESVCFRPELAPGVIIEQDGQLLVNIYVPVDVPRQAGDATPFLLHLAKVLPDQQDRDILLAYMAACVQHKGVKFQWAPLLQGVAGNGKTLFSRCVAAAVGRKYTHMPKASEIGEKFNEWLFDKLFIGVEEVHVPDQKREVWEVLKTMITNDWQPCRAMQRAEGMRECCANFIFNTNPKDALRKTDDDRRIAPFFTAQQSRADIIRDGMGGNYFPNLYAWLNSVGYAIVTDYLYAYAIPDTLNPATSCHRAPDTTSTKEAIRAGLGGLEQEVLEAVDEGRPGFSGGWISSLAFDRLLKSLHAERALPHSKRRELLQALGYDWHPALRDGRVNNPIPCDGGKPRLFIKTGHLAANLKTAAEVVKAYETAQTSPGGITAAAQAFNR